MDDLQRIIETLASGGIAVVRTDTLYGIIARANDRRAVEKVYAAKRREPSKQCIVLISGSGAVKAHSATIAAYSGLDQPPTSIVVPASGEKEWLLRGSDSIAYRVVRNDFLKRVVQTVGPVIAPSANPEGLEPARTIAEAKEYFGDLVDCYIDGGEVPKTTHASRILKVKPDGSVEDIRS